MVLEDRLNNNEVVILDGAIGSEIVRLGVKMDNAVWCGVANKTHPDTVCKVHEEYLRAGADVITANTFGTCRHVLAGAGLADEAAEITARAVKIAYEAIDKVAPDRDVAVAGSMSLMTAWIPGSFSPDPRFIPTPEEEAANYREWAEALASAGADLIILEMMADITHASMVAEATGDHYIEPNDFALHCRSLVEQGVQIIGGCCGTTIDHIRAMVNVISRDISSRSI